MITFVRRADINDGKAREAIAWALKVAAYINKTYGTDFKLPVYYYTELLAVAMDLPEIEEVLSGHRVKPDFALVADSSGEHKLESESPPSQ